ncbi:tetratricopeptide repeat protein [Anaerobacillus sp. CMMVII]|uniref:tetratricopeptide repeat protein n=1 Tax=Anaerobacillus sp. CMMVII TaxID=2755588 RepID=UPI0021B7F89D|nr:tetratricopeptide repeat protein [Anaerobacillus sp. CMMVII]MCT8138541.1 tetratricopeptide repeat protein [Anaerobacillus sp. CMMVII]
MSTKLASFVINEVVSLMKETKYEEARPLVINIIHELNDKKSYNYAKEFVNSINEADLLPLLRLLDASLMSRYSSLLVKMVHRNLHTQFTEILQCYELNYSGKYLEAEEKLKAILERNDSTLEDKVLERAYWALAHSLMEMKRFGEAAHYLNLLGKISSEPMYDRWGSFYYQKGEWDEAKKLFLQGIEHDPKPQYCYSLLQSLYLAEGNPYQALEVINDGIAKAPYYLPLRLEKAKRLKELEKWDEFLDEISHLEQLSPLHDYQNYFQYARAQIFYQKGEYGIFSDIVATHPMIFKGSAYSNYPQDFANKMVTIPTNVVVQKYNYCVPATVSMLLARYGIEKTQEEIAESIFHVNGSRLSVAVDYLTKIEMSCRYFFGTIENYQQLTDRGVSIIVCLDYPNASHVQLVRGYDENLKALLLQDPNFPEPFFIKYTDFEKHYGNNQCLSIAVVPDVDREKITLLNTNEDELVRKMYQFSDRMEKNDPTAVKEFEIFAETEKSLYTMSYVVKFFSVKDSNLELLRKTADLIMERQPESDYFKLIIAYAFARASDFEKATSILTTVKNQKVHLYHFLLGRMAYDQEQYLKAGSHYYHSLQVEGDHYDTWSYLSLCSYYAEETEKAISYSEISLDINNHDIWNRMNYGFILYHEEKWNEARALYTSLLREYKDHGHAWYERARCDQNLGRLHQALRGFQIAKQLEKSVPFPYVEIASIYAYHFENLDRAIIELQEGLTKTNPTDFGLLMTLADFYIAKENYPEAKVCYEKVLEHHPDEPTPLLAYAKVLSEVEEQEKAVNFLKEGAEKFHTNGPFFIEAGEWLMHHALNEVDEQKALDWIETGLSQENVHLDYSWNLYVNLVEETEYNDRARLFLLDQLEKNHQGNVNLMCYIGCLFEAKGELERAEQLYQEALPLEENTFPFYRLGEMALRKEEYATATHFYENCLKIDETFMVAYFRLAHIEKVTDHPDKEHEYLFSAFKQAPDDLDIEYFLELAARVERLPRIEEYLTSIKGEVEEVWRLQTLAFIAEMNEDLQHEATLIEEALAIEPENEGIQQHYANICYKQGRFQKAVELTLKLIKTDLENEQLYAILVASLHESKKLNTIKDVVLSLELSDQENSIVLMYAASAVVEQVLAIKEEKSSVISIFKSLKTKKLLKELKPQIIDLYKLSYEFDPNNGVGINWLCEYHCQHGDGPEVGLMELQTYLDKGWNFDIGFHFAYSVLEYFDAENTDIYEQAIEILNRCLQDEKELASVHSNLGQLYFDLEHIDEALQHLDQAIEFDPQMFNPYYAKSRIYEQLEEYPQMEECARYAIQLNPDFPDAYIQLGIAVYQQGRTEEALQYTEQLLQVDDLHLNGHYNKACFLTVLGNVEEAFEHLQFVLTNEDDHNYYRELAKTDPDLNVLRTNPLTAARMKKLMK